MDDVEVEGDDDVVVEEEEVVEVVATMMTTTTMRGAEDFARAQKLCKFAGSALQYEDVSTAVDNLSRALRLLTTGRE
ncbi:unnamed protein product [Lampetra fluviatilis]